MNCFQPFLFIILLLSLNLNSVVGQVCSLFDYINHARALVPGTTVGKVRRDLADNKCIPRMPDVGNKHQVGGINDFCVAVVMWDSPASKTHPLRSNSAATECYRAAKTTENWHAAGLDPHYALIDHLARFKARSFQDYNDFPFVAHDIYDGYFVRLEFPYKLEGLPKPKAANPYFVEVTGISMKGELLHNFLHLRVFANMSVTMGKDQLGEDSKILHGAGAEGFNEQRQGRKEPPDSEKQNFATGRISAMIMMVKDQDGWPIGDFSTSIPCDRTCFKYSHDVHQGDETNALPCSYTPPYASSHPGMFIFDADPGRYCPYVANRKASLDNSTKDPRLQPETARKQGVREVHATWSFSHDTCNFATTLHIETLIFEDLEKVYSTKMQWVPSDNWPYDKTLIFGWSAQYNILRPTRQSLGAADYVNLKYFKERNARKDEIDCHVPLFDAQKTVPFNFEKFVVPAHGVRVSGADQPDTLITSKIVYHGGLSANLNITRTLRYFGQDGPSYPTSNYNSKFQFPCRPLPSRWERKPDSISTFLLSEAKDRLGIRCPCPAHPSPEPIENRTADPARLHGRLIHASHMAIAYMFLTPIGCFVARFYKETFVTVFCFQEYWWFMWHVVTLIVACMFNIGAITSIARKKQVEIRYNDNLVVHIILGCVSIFVFYMEIVTGFFRVANAKKRLRQIFMHWLIGTLNNACAVMSMFAMAWVDQSGFSCNVAWTTLVWLIFVIACYAIMEYNMRRTDKKLRLIPRRSYLPPPVKRLFTKESPGRNFRMGMLVFFIIGLLIIQGAVSYFIWHVEGGASCEEEYKTAAQERKSRVSTGPSSSGGSSGGQAVNPNYYN